MNKLQSVVAIFIAMLFAGSCGGGVQGITGVDADLALDSGFHAVRFNSEGKGDPSLADTVSLEVSSRSSQVVVLVAIDDSIPMQDIVVHLEYDASRFSPVSTEFMELVENCVELSIANVVGLVGLCQTTADPARTRRGQFAEVTFEREPMPQRRQVSNPQSKPVNVMYDPDQITQGKSGFEISKSTAEDGDPATCTIYSIFATGDGDDNGETNLSDITPLVSLNVFKEVTDTNFGPAGTDYDRNGEANLTDLTQIVLQFSKNYTGLEVLLGNSPTLTSGDILRPLAFADGTPAQRTGSNSTTADWRKVFRTWDVSITVEDMQAVDTDEDGTVYISALVVDGVAVGGPAKGEAFTGLALTYETGPPVITGIELSFPGDDIWAKDPDSGDYLVIITENSVDGEEGNSEPFAPENIGVEATVTIEGQVDPVVNNSLVLWHVFAGGGLGNVDNLFEKGKVTFNDRGRLVIQAQAIGDFGVTGDITFLLCSIDSLALELEGGGVGPVDVNSGSLVQFVATGTFDWDSVDNGNEVDLDLTTICSWAGLPDGTNTGMFVINSDIGSLSTTSADSGDSIRVTCEYPGTDNITIYDNLKRASNFVRVNIN